ncbi:MAG: hypothetical protein Q9226_009151, partial [Calogaya cf. arnoldii]
NGASLPSILFGSLTYFICLKRLAIPEGILVGTGLNNQKIEELLPPTMVILQLQYGMGYYQGYTWERHLRAVRVLKLPLLERFIWWDQQPECFGRRTYEASSGVFELRNKFRQNGVRFQYKNTPYYRETPLAGDESRNDFDVGVEYGFPMEDIFTQGFYASLEEFDHGIWLDEHLGM